jgi:hypothetical protein
LCSTHPPAFLPPAATARGLYRIKSCDHCLRLLVYACLSPQNLIHRVSLAVQRIQSDDYLQSWRHYLADPRMTSGGAGRIRSARYFHCRATCYWWFGQRPWADTSNIVGTCLSNVGIRRRCIPVRTWKCSSAFRWSIFGVAAISEPSSIARSQTVKNNLDGSGYDLKYGRPRCALS